MEKIKKQFRSWDILIQKTEYRIIFEELKNLIAKKTLSSRDEALLASWCLVSLNIVCKKSFSNVHTDFKYLVDLHSLSVLCCELVSKSWTSIEHDFVTSVFYICKTLLARNYISEACEIGQFVFTYFDEVPNAKLIFGTHEIDVPSRFVCLFLHTATSCEAKSGEKDKSFLLWDTILSIPEKRIIRANISNVVDYFSTFLQTISIDDFVLRKGSLIHLMTMLKDGINLNKSGEQIFFKFLRSTVNKLCEFSLKNNADFFFDCLNHCSREKSTPIQFCENVYRICTGIHENVEAFETINICYSQLQMLVLSNALIFNDVIYCSSTIIVRMQLGKIKDYTLNKISVQNLLTILFTLAQRLYHMDINELFLEKRMGTRKIDFGSVAILSTDVISCCTAIKKVDLADEEIYKTLLDAEKLAITCLKSMDERRKEQMKFFFGGSCINVCREYLMANLHSRCKDLCILVLQYYSSLPATELSSQSLKLIVSKLVLCLCGNYRSLEMYEDWIRTALSWSLIMPVNADAFMEQYCTAKYKLTSSNIKLPYIDYTCVEILKDLRNDWKHRNLEIFDACQISLMELKAYLTHNLILPKPFTKLFELLNTQSFLSRISKGNIDYAKFRLKLLRFRKESKVEWETLIPNKSDPTSQEEEYVLASYNFNSQNDNLRLLNIAIDNWTSAIDEFSRSSCDQDFLEELELSYIKEAALIYRQYCDNEKEVKAWKLMFKASKLAKNETLVINAFSNLLCSSWKISLKWMKEVEEEMFDKVDEASKMRYRLDLWSRSAVNGFTSDEKKLLKELTLENAEKYNLQAKYCYLISRAYFYRTLEDTADPFGMSYKAITILMDSLKNVKWNNFAETCELECMLVDVSVFMVARCAEKFEFHNAKKFIQEPLKIVQMLGLPLRTCQLLNLSAFLDTIVGNVEDCYVKLQYASSILNHNVKAVTKIRSHPEPITMVSSDLRFVRTDYDVDFEDNPALNSELQFEMPAFAHHQKKCECDICVNREYLKLYCELMSLYGIYFRLLKKWAQVDGFFQGVFKLLNFIKKRVDVDELKVCSLIQCGNYWAAKNCIKEAILCTQKAHKMFKTNEKLNVALRASCVDQRWQEFAVQFFEEINNLLIIQGERKEVARPNLLEQVEGARTNRKLRDTIESAPITPRPRKSRKMLLFDDFTTPPSENSSEKQKEFTTPPAIVMQLPATTKKRRTRRCPNE